MTKEKGFPIDRLPTGCGKTYFVDGVSFSVYATSVVTRGIGSRSSQIKDYDMGIYCFSTMHAALWSKTG